MALITGNLRVFSKLSYRWRLRAYFFFAAFLTKENNMYLIKKLTC
ncbi:hypothetical protein HMPREF9444_01370 [Succinatimonas hippei YIT 12066]|uniref:Uncharacterized protein n=1 Tax=Succinatimonas hippei (strain DSM 22608 / JCM 16073 / KCTC 15190 / YIT 12066) TaxID=762983 RepID=E8LKX0_SUCHY|nr:hypothetical protein HMPREF9444_01370 [Succinatimonas hippei YIT 12066]